jgi:hypothetical protein
MNKNIVILAGILFACLVLPAVQGCGGGYEVAALAPAKPFRIDGKADDWAGHLLYYRDAKLTVGVSNDANFFYLCVTSSDQSVYRSILMRGLTVWFDTTAGKGKYFGMRFPVGMSESEMPAGDQPPASFDEMLKRRAEGATKLEVLGAEKDNRTEILLPGKDGMEARIGYQSGVFAYEMKIPLGVDIADGRRLTFAHGDQLSLRFETPEFEGPRARTRDRSQMGMSGSGTDDGGGEGEDAGFGGRGGRSGGGRGGRGGRGGAENQAMRESHAMESIDFLLKVEKAK